MKRVMSDGILRFKCPKCDEQLEVGLHVIYAFDKECEAAQQWHLPARKHPVEFIAEAPHLHAHFWGHMVRRHQPCPHPYMSYDADEVS